MKMKTGWRLGLSIAALLASPVMPCYGADPDADALALRSPEEKATATPTDAKFSIEGALGRGQRRFTSGSDSLRRLSADLIWSARLGEEWRFHLSDRVDAVDPHGAASTINSLREIYLGWQDPGAAWIVEFGRINLRQGPALGFNPTDYFRDGSVRVSTTVNPALVREYRLGSVMARAQRLWTGGSVSLAVSPKLADSPSSAGFSADLGSTNNRDRALLSLGTQWSPSASSQFHLYHERGGQAQLGASFSGLMGDATVAYAEGSWGRERSLLDRARGVQTDQTASRVAAGLTYSTASKLSVTGELQFNGFATSRSQRNAIGATQPAELIAYLIEAERRQDLPARRAVLLYARQTDAGMRNLDATVLVRWNAEDRSTLAWIELRHRFANFDLAAQWLRYRGASFTEFGSSPYRTTLQVLATAYF